RVTDSSERGALLQKAVAAGDTLEPPHDLAGVVDSPDLEIGVRAGHIKDGERVPVFQKAVVPSGIRERPNDLASTVDPEGKGGIGARYVDRGERGAILEKAGDPAWSLN